jgi:hypothetical protein
MLNNDQKKLGQLCIVAAPSGGGKTSLVNQLMLSMPKIELSNSHTTRATRPKEKHGKDYFFVDVRVLSLTLALSLVRDNFSLSCSQCSFDSSRILPETRNLYADTQGTHVTGTHGCLTRTSE